MITAKFYKKDNGSIHMTLKGHAGAAPKGDDLICASATMLAYTAAQAIQFMYERRGMLRCKPKIDIKEGRATVIATPTEDGYAEVLHAFWVVQCGIHLLAQNYPQCVRLEHLKL